MRLPFFLLPLLIAPVSAQDSAHLYQCADGSMFFAAIGTDQAVLEAFGLTWALPLTRANRYAGPRLAVHFGG